MAVAAAVGSAVADMAAVDSATAAVARVRVLVAVAEGAQAMVAAEDTLLRCRGRRPPTDHK